LVKGEQIHQLPNESDYMNTNMFPDFGNVRDNESAFLIALHEINHGDKAWGHEVLLRLRDHIGRTKETKSVQWILPKVLTALEEFDSRILVTSTL